MKQRQDLHTGDHFMSSVKPKLSYKSHIVISGQTIFFFFFFFLQNLTK